jgi:predicted secreted Zn-dependent protease
MGVLSLFSMGVLYLLLPASAVASEYLPAARITVSSFHSTRYYQVSGDTQEDVWAQLQGPANPFEVDPESGARPLGHASFQYQYDYQSAYGANSSYCRVDSGEMVFRFETVLPQLAAQQNTGGQLQDRWLPFQRQISEHEAGHHAIYRQLAAELPQALTDIGEVPCSELDDRVKLAIAEAVSATRQASVEYDENYAGSAYLASSL